MKQKVIIILLGLLAGGVIGGSVYYFVGKKSLHVSSSSSFYIPQTPTPTVVPLVSYKNPSGFLFRYPQSVTLKEIENSDASYAEILLTSSDRKGNVSFKVMDTEATSAEDWIQREHISTASSQMHTIPFADIEAIEIASNGGIFAVSYDQGALFLLSADFQENAPFWKMVYNYIIESFEFVEPEEDSAPQPQNSGRSVQPGIIFEGEEIVE